MKVLSRDFTTKEKILLIILAVILVGLTYYQFFDKPVREATDKAIAEKANLETEQVTLEAQLANLKKMQAELDSMEGMENVRIMPSYNAIKQIHSLLNDVLGSLGYSITFNNATRSGDQVRQRITMSFRCPDLDTAVRVLTDLQNGEFRCLIEDLSVSMSTNTNNTNNNDRVSVSTTITFYETMVGGTLDPGIPAE
jgi:hypothetical protein